MKMELLEESERGLKPTIQSFALLIWSAKRLFGQKLETFGRGYNSFGDEGKMDIFLFCNMKKIVKLNFLFDLSPLFY